MGYFTIMQFLFQVNRVKNALNTTFYVTLCTLSLIKCYLNPYASVALYEFKGQRLKVNVLVEYGVNAHAPQWDRRPRRFLNP
jgi:hypothetical protein